MKSSSAVAVLTFLLGNPLSSSSASGGPDAITKHQTLTWGREEAECGGAGHTCCSTLAVLLTHTTHADQSSGFQRFICSTDFLPKVLWAPVSLLGKARNGRQILSKTAQTQGHNNNHHETQYLRLCTYACITITTTRYSMYVCVLRTEGSPQRTAQSSIC